MKPNWFIPSTNTMLLPADPKASYLGQKQAIDSVIHEVLDGGAYILGPKVRLFEGHFAAYLGCTHCVAVANGTDAIQLALRACGVGPGDKVITVSHTAVATVAAIDWIGATPVLVDINPETFTIAPDLVAETLRADKEKRVKAVVAVHLYGHPADLEALMRMCEKYGVALLEDCAQAHGAMINGRKVGSIGACGAFSFYPTKNLGAFGDGGAVTTSDDKLRDKLRLLQQYGWRERYISDERGYNSRLDELQAGILDVKLPHLDAGNARRRAMAETYCTGLADLPIRCPIQTKSVHHVFHQFVIRLEKRDALRLHLEKAGIKTSILYPVPIHLQRGYEQRVELGTGAMPVTEQVAREILCLPIYPELSDGDVARVLETIQAYYG